MKLKKILAGALALCFAASLASCGEETTANNANTQQVGGNDSTPSVPSAPTDTTPSVPGAPADTTPVESTIGSTEASTPSTGDLQVVTKSGVATVEVKDNEAKFIITPECNNYVTVSNWYDGDMLSDHTVVKSVKFADAATKVQKEINYDTGDTYFDAYLEDLPTSLEVTIEFENYTDRTYDVGVDISDHSYGYNAKCDCGAEHEIVNVEAGRQSYTILDGDSLFFVFETPSKKFSVTFVGDDVAIDGFLSAGEYRIRGNSSWMSTLEWDDSDNAIKYLILSNYNEKDITITVSFTL